MRSLIANVTTNTLTTTFLVISTQILSAVIANLRGCEDNSRGADKRNCGVDRVAFDWLTSRLFTADCVVYQRGNSSNTTTRQALHSVAYMLLARRANFVHNWAALTVQRVRRVSGAKVTGHSARDKLHQRNIRNTIFSQKVGPIPGCEIGKGENRTETKIVFNRLRETVASMIRKFIKILYSFLYSSLPSMR